MDFIYSTAIIGSLVALLTFLSTYGVVIGLSWAIVIVLNLFIITPQANEEEQ